MKHSRRFRPAAGEPCFAITHHGQAAIARRECAFVRKRIWRPLPNPMFTAVPGSQNDKPPIHWISQHDAVPRIPKCQRVEKTLRIGIGELQSPVRAAISCFVDARLVAFATANEISSSFVQRMHAAKIKLFGARNCAYSPRHSAVRRFQIRAASSASPDHFRIHRAHTSERCSGSARMKRPRLRLRDAQKNQWYQNPHRLSVIKIRTSRQFSLEYFREVAGNAPFAHVAGPGANPVRKGWTTCDQTCTKLLWSARVCCAPNGRIERPRCA